jgi:hypothetical protein
MTDTPHEGPQPIRYVPVFAKAEAVQQSFAAWIDTDPLFPYLYVLAMEETLALEDPTPVAVAHASFTDPQDQGSLDSLRTVLQQAKTSPLAYLLQHVRAANPAMDRLFGGSLDRYLLEMTLGNLGTLPADPGPVHVERLSPDNPLRVHSSTDTGMLVEFPHHVEITSTHLWDLLQYRRSWRPPGQPGAPRKSQAAPTTLRPTPTDAESDLAWEFKKQFPHATREDVVRFLWRDVPMRTEAERRRAKARADSRVSRGRRRASGPRPSKKKRGRRKKPSR